MAVALIIPSLLIAALKSCQCDHANGFGIGGNNAARFGELLKPPPVPLPQIVPVPFHGGSSRPQRENLDVGYHYPPPSPPSSQPILAQNDFKFPSPFYKQYNFNFVPPPQPFTTTPSPSLFQKVSTWLFPSQQTSYDAGLSNNNNLSPIKKDCNPCNLVPWIPVIKYNSLGNKIIQNPISTYGPPSPTAFADVQSVIQYQPQPFQSQVEERLPPHLTPGTPAANYGPPALPVQTPTISSIGPISSTYGPPSPTHTVELNTQHPHSSTFSLPISTYGLPSHTYSVPNRFINAPSVSYLPGLPNGVPDSNFIASSTYRPPTPYASPTPSYLRPSPSYGTPYSVSTYEPVTPPYEPKVPEREKPTQSDVEIIRDNIEPFDDLQLPKVNPPTRFKNSYGEPIINTNIFDIPYPVTAMAAESTKIRTEVLPETTYKRPATPNVSLALSNPAPFTLNRGRNIHTLQPVALPNLSVSPLPPIFNARPFRPITPFPSNVVHGINHMQHVSNNVNIAQSVPLVEFTHSVDYPATYVQAPVIDIDSSKPANQSKSYRNIPNSYVIDEVRDISSQASEDHVSATKTGSDVSFESTGSDVGNDIYDSSVPTDLKLLKHRNPQSSFTDLRGVKDEDVDKFRTESNLQNIDSPLLYLKPSAPHKSHGDFLIAVSTPISSSEYEIYDDIPTTVAPLLPTIKTWHESKSDYSDKLAPSGIQKDVYKPKIVQIIVPYTTGQKEVATNEHFAQGWTDLSEEEHQGRKVPLNTDKPHLVTESDEVLTTTTEASAVTLTENYDPDQSKPTVTFTDFYDVKEPPFDIIKLQHTIDDWTEQEYSKDYKTPQRTRSSDKYAKQIPDEYFTTTVPTNYPTDPETFNDELYDHESASSIQHSVTEETNSTFNKAHKEYNTIERSKGRQANDKNEILRDVQKLHIYTAASSFRTTSSSTTSTTTTTTTTPAPWDKIQTSISPLTKEKVYLVTSKPWRETRHSSNDWYAVESPFESKKTKSDSDDSDSDNLPFKSPRFINRPSFGFTSGGKIESVRSDALFGFSKSWYQSSKHLSFLHLTCIYSNIS
ncbi:hypothetical protein O3G_MSEX006745 [Manduca sexta]|uniref:Uncharacterized protein n=1 Tax=Manduca sexta TaxID=7130 RepID=A0A921Z5B7_MANSE|nr:hypothetical protein O3G_MSEX006745 [Manduca sexta]